MYTVYNIHIYFYSYSRSLYTYAMYRLYKYTQYICYTYYIYYKYYSYIYMCCSYAIVTLEILYTKDSET